MKKGKLFFVAIASLMLAASCSDGQDNIFEYPSKNAIRLNPRIELIHDRDKSEIGRAHV